MNTSKIREALNCLNCEFERNTCISIDVIELSARSVLGKYWLSSFL